jgi:hypothetical protein
VQQIWRLRAQFYYRKIAGYPAVVEAAKGEAVEFVRLIADPTKLTYKQLALVAL